MAIVGIEPPPNLAAPVVPGGDYVVIRIGLDESGAVYPRLAISKTRLATDDVGFGDCYLIRSGAIYAIEAETEVEDRRPIALPTFLAEEDIPTRPTAPPRETILLVEDEDYVRHYTAYVLASQGYNVIEASSGPQALDILEAAEHVDLIFTDLFLPGGMNGAQFANAVRRSRPNMPIVFTSGFAEEAARAGLSSDAIILAKPYRRAEMATKIRQALRSTFQSTLN
nr:response regulator [Acuticoccus kalidii]